jgi:hypothetical protein
VAPYQLPTDPETEAVFEEAGFSRNDDVVPSRLGVPAKVDLDGKDFDKEAARFFDEGPPTDRQLKRLQAPK